jgi:hypothetical protein
MPVLSQSNPVHVLTPPRFKAYFDSSLHQPNAIFPSDHTKWSLSVWSDALRRSFQSSICKDNSYIALLALIKVKAWWEGVFSSFVRRRVGPKVFGLTYKSRAKWKMLRGIYSAIYGEVNISVSGGYMLQYAGGTHASSCFISVTLKFGKAGNFWTLLRNFWCCGGASCFHI